MLDGWDTVFVLIGLYVLFLLVWSVVSLILLINQRGRIRSLEQRLADLTLRIEAGAASAAEAGPASAEAAPSPSPAADAEAGTAVAEGSKDSAAVQTEAPGTPEAERPAAPAPDAAPASDGAPGPAPAPDAEPEPAPAAAAAFAGGDLESRIGGRLFVWLGAVALALAGGFLVKYSIDEGLLTPARRVAGGYGLGFAMLAVGHRLARSSERIAAAVLAAGIATLYAASYAAGSLYGLIGPPATFAVMVAVTTAAELLALRHGRLVAHVGLAGGYLTPLLVASPEPNVPVLFGYLFVLTVGLGLVGTRKPWPDLTVLAVAAGFAWAGLWLSAAFDPGEVPVVALYLLALTALSVAFGLAAGGAVLPRGLGAVGSLLVRGGVAAGGLLLVALALEDGHGTPVMLALWLYTAAAMALARRDQDWPELAVIAPAFAFLALVDWNWPSRDWQADAPIPAPGAAVTLYLMFAATWALGGGAAAFGARRPGLWAAVATVPVVVLGLVAYAKDLLLLGDVGWAFLALAVAALYAAAAAGWARYTVPEPERDGVLAAFVTAAAGLIAIAVSLVVTEAWVGLAWSLTVLAMGLVSVRLAVPALRVFAAVLAGFASLAVILEAGGTLDLPAGPGAFVDAVARTGLPAAALAAGAIALARRGDDLWARAVQAMAAVLGALFVYGAVRSWFPAPALPGAQWNGWELGLVVVLIAGYALALERLAARTAGRPDTRLLPAIAAAAAGLALAAIGYGAGQVWPVGGAEPVGATPVLNALLLLYLVPALFVRRLVDGALAPFRTTPTERARIGGALALVLAFGWATLAVRQGFHAPRLFPGAVGTAELWAYSAVWLAFALAMFGAGLVLAKRPLRAAGLGVMTLALAKAFLWDAAALDGLWRVASFLGLGIALLLIAWLFQRFVGTSGRASPAPTPD